MSRELRDVLQGPPDADVQREVAAALESVFPRVGLKAFVALSADDKSSQVRACCGFPSCSLCSESRCSGALQLKELSHLILGIRLFNWEIGKGGAGITDIPKTVTDTIAELERRVQAQVDNTAELCEQYVDVLVAPAAAIESVPGESDAGTTQARWREELANRRQLAAFLTTIGEDVHEDKTQFEAALASFR